MILYQLISFSKKKIQPLKFKLFVVDTNLQYELANSFYSRVIYYIYPKIHDVY